VLSPVRGLALFVAVVGLVALAATELLAVEAFAAGRADLLNKAGVLELGPNDAVGPGKTGCNTVRHARELLRKGRRTDRRVPHAHLGVVELLHHGVRGAEEKRKQHHLCEEEDGARVLEEEMSQ
jgi:hypothetical protein